MQMKTHPVERWTMATSTTDLSATLATAVVPVHQDLFGRAREHVSRIVEMTRTLFPDGLECAEQEDAEIPGDRYFLLRVKDSGSLEAVLARHNQWHQKLVELPPGIRTCFRLAIDHS
jgi:hypothetical protein